MKLYYDEKGYNCTRKSGYTNTKNMSSKSRWYSSNNQSYTKLKVTIPQTIFDKILSDIKKDIDNKTLFDIFKFNLHINDGYGKGFYYIESYLDSTLVCSKFRNGDITVIFNIRISKELLLDKSYLRDVMLNELMS